MVNPSLEQVLKQRGERSQRSRASKGLPPYSDKTIKQKEEYYTKLYNHYQPYLDKWESMKKEGSDSYLRQIPGSGYRLQQPNLSWLPGFLTNKTPNTIEMNVHGGGGFNNSGRKYYSISTDNGKARLRRTDDVYVDRGDVPILDQLKNTKGIDTVLSNACNDAGGSPEFYEGLFGNQLNKVVMTPPGYENPFVGGWSKYPAKLLHGMGFKQYSPLHEYHKTDNQWADTGEYNSSIDKFLQGNYGKIGLGLGAAGLMGYAYHQKK